MAELESFTESREMALAVIAMVALVVGGGMLWHSVMPTVGAAVLAISFLCMFAVVAIA